jgi:integrase
MGTFHRVGEANFPSKSGTYARFCAVRTRNFRLAQRFPLDVVSLSVFSYFLIFICHIVISTIYYYLYQLRNANCGKRALPATLRLHDCRHFAATAMIADGVDICTVAGLLGYADPLLMVRAYVHDVSEAARRAADRMGALIDTKSDENKAKIA